MGYDEIIKAVRDVGFPAAVGVALLCHFFWFSRHLHRQNADMLERFGELRDELGRVRTLFNIQKELQAQLNDRESELREIRRESEAARREAETILREYASGSVDRHRGHSGAPSQVQVKYEKGIAVCRFTNRKILDELVIAEVREELMDVLESTSPPLLLLDFQGVENLSSAALGVLITINKAVHERKGNLTLASVNGHIVQILKAIRLDKLFTLFEDTPTALASMVADAHRVASQDPKGHSPHSQ